MKKYLWIALALVVVAPALAEAPKALQIYLNQRPYAGKAIWYKDEIYVPLADVVRNLGGSFAYNHTTGVVNVSIGAPLPPPNAVQMPQSIRPQTDNLAGDSKPLVKVTWDNRTLFGDNAKVTATVQNVGTAPAVNVDAVCIFFNNAHDTIGTSTRFLGSLAPGESRSADFWLFDPKNSTAGLAYGYGAGFDYGRPSLNNSQSPFATIDVGTYQTQIQYEFKLNYR